MKLTKQRHNNAHETTKIKLISYLNDNLHEIIQQNYYKQQQLKLSHEPMIMTR